MQWNMWTVVRYVHVSPFPSKGSLTASSNRARRVMEYFVSGVSCFSWMSVASPPSRTYRGKQRSRGQSAEEVSQNSWQPEVPLICPDLWGHMQRHGRGGTETFKGIEEDMVMLMWISSAFGMTWLCMLWRQFVSNNRNFLIFHCSIRRCYLALFCL